MDSADPRFEHVSEYVLKTFKLKPDKWSKLLGNEEYRILIQEFFDKQESAQLIISLNGTGALVPSYEFPASGKNKSVYFLKKDKKENIGKDNFKTALLYGDLSSSPLEQLSALVDEVSMSKTKFGAHLLLRNIPTYSKCIRDMPQPWNCHSQGQGLASSSVSEILASGVKFHSTFSSCL